MKSFRQVLRQPIKFIAGLILMTVAAAIVCVCVGQALAAQNTAEQLDKQFTTVALPLPFDWDRLIEPGDTRVEVKAVTDGVMWMARQWLEETAQSNPEIIKTVAEHGIISAYIPELTPLNYTQSDYITENIGATIRAYHYNPGAPAGIPYSCAMLVVTLEEVSEPVELVIDSDCISGQTLSIKEFGSEELYHNWLDKLGDKKLIAGYEISLAGTVTEVVSLQEGYRDPTGMTARLSISFQTLEELEALDLKIGEQYIVYGMDYYDEDWALRGYLADERHENPLQIDTFDLNKLQYMTEEEIERSGNQHSGVVARYDGRVFLKKQQCNQINAVSMTLMKDLRYRPDDRSLMPYHDHSPHVNLQSNVSYTDRKGDTVIMSWEEYKDRYQIPTIARLEGSVDDFLQSEEGIFWQQSLERDTINNHAFAVLGIDKLEYLVDFAREESRITQGRDFTSDEQKNGARVCILHEQLAAANGLEVGDTITLNMYNGDYGLPYQRFRNERHGVLTPSADFYFDTTPILETAEYTIVGTYRSRDLWTDVAQNEYGLSPNTVIVPKTSVETPLEYSDGILFNTVVLQNGRQEDFAVLAAEADFRGQFSYYDQGYSDIAGNFHNYEALAGQVLSVGAAVYGVILLLFLLLFPGTQGKTVGTMESLGVTRGKRFAHVMLSSLIVVAPATVLGGAIGMLLWQSVIDTLKASAETAVSLQLGMGTLLLIALAQFTLAMGLSAIIAAWVTAPKSLAERRAK